MDLGAAIVKRTAAVQSRDTDLTRRHQAIQPHRHHRSGQGGRTTSTSSYRAPWMTASPVVSIVRFCDGGSCVISFNVFGNCGLLRFVSLLSLSFRTIKFYGIMKKKRINQLNRPFKNYNMQEKQLTGNVNKIVLLLYNQAFIKLFHGQVITKEEHRCV